MKITGDFYNGHLYGLPKIHKNATAPPLRPIISMSGTVTHELAQYLNRQIRPYIDRSHMISSSDELLIKLHDITLHRNQVLASLDVESLFTNVPIETTIDIIIATAYNHHSLPPPQIDADVMRQLLKICTTATPFSFNGTNYVQKEGVSMGSPLGPTFADFYMSHVENYLLSQNRVSNPVFYVRYVDDTLAIFNSNNHVRHFINRLKANSVLNFTFDKMTDNCFNFLDIKLSKQPDGKFATSVFIKPTDKGVYMNYNAFSPEIYKKSILKTLIFRAYKYSSTWLDFDTEINRLKQVFANNSYPQNLTESIINDLLSKHHRGIIDTTRESIPHIDYYVHLQNLSTFKIDTKQIKTIINTHCKPLGVEAISVKTYFKSLKLSSTRNKREYSERVNVVYQFTCSEGRCNAAYLGYTTNTLSTRCKQHRYSGSSIREHFQHDHSMLPPPFESLIKNFTILHSYQRTIDLKLAEAIEIKNRNPFINIKYNEMSTISQLFK